MQQYHFKITGTWAGGRLGEGIIETEGTKTAVAVPKDMGGPGTGTNPEELLMSAAANCYMITLAAILEKRQTGIERFELKTEGTVTQDGGKLKFEKIIHKPHIVLKEASEEQIKQIEAFAHRAEQVCFISQTLRGSVEISVEPLVEAAGQ
ncbi:MAG: OsmC family protein [Ectobacillus sp.]